MGRPPGMPLAAAGKRVGPRRRARPFSLARRAVAWWSLGGGDGARKGSAAPWYKFVRFRCGRFSSREGLKRSSAEGVLASSQPCPPPLPRTNHHRQQHPPGTPRGGGREVFLHPGARRRAGHAPGGGWPRPLRPRETPPAPLPLALAPPWQEGGARGGAGRGNDHEVAARRRRRRATHLGPRPGPAAAPAAARAPRSEPAAARPCCWVLSSRVLLGSSSVCRERRGRTREMEASPSVWRDSEKKKNRSYVKSAPLPPSPSPQN